MLAQQGDEQHDEQNFLTPKQLNIDCQRLTKWRVIGVLDLRCTRPSAGRTWLYLTFVIPDLHRG